MTTSTLAPTLRSPSLWGRLALAIAALEAAMIAAAFGWVAFYSYFIRPGGDPAFYEAYSKTACPVVSVVAGVPVFFAAGRWLSRIGGIGPVLVTVLGYAAIDVLLIALLATGGKDK